MQRMSLHTMNTYTLSEGVIALLSETQTGVDLVRHLSLSSHKHKMALGGVCSNKRRIIEATWWVAVLLSVAYIVSAITAAVRANQGHSPSKSRPTAFAAVWSMLLLISIIAYGSVTMKKLQTPISVGVFIGVTAMFSQLELLMFAIFTQRSQEVLDAHEAAADRAIASVSFFLAVVFGIFTVMLFSFRQAIPDPAASAPSTTSDSYA